jgi:hypothetical protein
MDSEVEHEDGRTTVSNTNQCDELKRATEHYGHQMQQLFIISQVE